MKIAVVGTGYVGLVAGACLAENGNEVVCVDGDAARLRLLRRGKIPFYEPGLEELVRRNRGEKRLVFTSQVASAVRQAGIIFIALGTPQGEDGAADVGPVLAVAKEIAHAMNGYKVVVAQDTVPVGTAARLREVVRRETTHPFSVVSNPEFLAQGRAVEDFMKPDRVVIGAEDGRAGQLMTELYAPFTRTGAPVLLMDCASAEMSKYAVTGLRATGISFMNEVARACDLHGADVDQVRRAVAADGRHGPASLFPGIGFGGSCVPRDIRAMMKSSADAGYCLHLLDAAERVNRAQPSVLVDKMLRHFGSLRGKTIALWGLAFKPNTDDMREAPSIAVVERLADEGASIQAFDPQAMANARVVFGSRVKLAASSYDALAGADALALLTEWNEFREPDFAKMRKLMRAPVVFDGRNIYSRERMKADGFTYFGIGR